MKNPHTNGYSRPLLVREGGRREEGGREGGREEGGTEGGRVLLYYECVLSRPLPPPHLCCWMLLVCVPVQTWASLVRRQQVAPPLPSPPPGLVVWGVVWAA